MPDPRVTAANHEAVPRPNYRIPRAAFASVSASIFTSFPRRTLSRDASLLLNSYQPRPIITGIEHIPRSGPVLFVANHHHRKQMWIGWCGSLLIEAINQVRPARVPVHIVVADEQRIPWRGGEAVLPMSKFFLRRVSEFWDMVQIPGNPANTAGQARALRAVLTLLKQDKPVLLFPEGEIGSAYTLVEAKPRTGTFITLASRRAPIVPVAFWEDGDQLHGQIAPSITIVDGDDTAVRTQVMTAIGQILPPSMWGPYAGSIGASR